MIDGALASIVQFIGMHNILSIVMVDAKISFWIQDHMIMSWLTFVTYWVSKITSSGLLWIIISIILMAQKKYRMVGLGMFLSLVLVFIVGDQTLKPHVARLRPFVQFPQVVLPATPPDPHTYSFPSGHATGSFSSSVALLLGLCSVNLKKAYWGVLAILFAAFVAFARVYLFVHFTSDVVVGAILGIIMGIIAWAITRALSRMKVLEKIFNYSYKGKF